MGRELLDVEHPQAVRGEHATHGEQREVAEVLVVDRVELALLDQTQQVRELDGDHAGGLEQDLHPGNEVVEIRHVSQDVVGEQQIGGDVRPRSERAVSRPKNSMTVGMPFSTATSATLAAGLDPEHGHLALVKYCSR